MNKWLRFIFLGILLFFSTFGAAQAQRVLGAVWDLPADESQAIQELQQFRELGISVLELHESPSDRIWSEINQHNLTVYGELGILFPATHTFTAADSSFYAGIQKKVTDFATQPAVKALGLFAYGAVHHSSFNEATTSFFNHFRSLQSTQTYYTGNREELSPDLPTDFFIYDIRLTSQDVQSLSVPVSSSIGGYRYRPSDELKGLLVPLKQVISETAAHPKKPLFLEGHWLLSMVDRHPPLQTVLQSLSSDSDFIFPTPDESWPSSSQSPLPIIILLLVWGVLAFHYNMSPLYRKSLFRYFTGHNFFVNDIFRQHIRSPSLSLIIIIQNALLVAAVLFTVLLNFWSHTGLQGLNYHFPSLFFADGNEHAIFIAVFGITLIFSLVSILWLYFSHKSLRSITQIMTLFAWPLQLNIIFGTLAIAIHVSGGDPSFIALLAGSMVAVCLGSFMITSFDAIKYSTGDKLRYISLTAGLYLLVFVALAIWLLEFNDPFWEVIDLSMNLK